MTEKKKHIQHEDNWFNSKKSISHNDCVLSSLKVVQNRSLHCITTLESFCCCCWVQVRFQYLPELAGAPSLAFDSPLAGGMTSSPSPANWSFSRAKNSAAGSTSAWSKLSPNPSMTNMRSLSRSLVRFPCYLFSQTIAILCKNEYQSNKNVTKYV